MAITFEVYNDGGWVDLSGYVIASGLVPYLQRNRDYEVIAPVFDCTISQATALLFKDDKVRIKSGATVFFSGHILTIKNDAARRVWRVQISSALYKLRDYNCNYGELHDDISTNGSDYDDYSPAAGDTEGFPNVRVLFLLERMFVLAGLTLDVSGIEDDVMFSTIFNTILYNVLMKDVKIDEQALYAVNQSAVAKYAPGGESAESGLEINFLDFVKKFCSITGLFIQVTSDMAFVLYNTSVGETYSIADDDKYDYSSEEITARAVGYSFIQNFGSVGDYRSGYNQGGTSSPVTQRETGEGNEIISWYNHLFFMVRVKPTPAITNAVESPADTITITTTGMSSMDVGDYVIIEGVTGMTDLNGQFQVTFVNDPTSFKVTLDTAQTYTSGGTWKYAGAVYLNYHIAQSPFLTKRIREITEDYTEEIIITAIDLTVKSVVNNSVDMKNRVSKITQESY